MGTQYDNYWQDKRFNPTPINQEEVNKKFDYLGLTGLVTAVISGCYLIFMTFWMIVEVTLPKGISDGTKIILILSLVFLFIMWIILMLGLFLTKRRAMVLSVTGAAITFAEIIFNAILIVCAF